jgi:putative chitinase
MGDRQDKIKEKEMSTILTKDQLKQMVKNPHIDHWYEVLEQLLDDYDISTPLRVAHFIVQCAHESGNFVFIKENLNYKAASLRKIFGKYFPTDELAAQYANKPEMIANRIYANRMGNGDEASGDGYRYCGRGLIQLTGKDNYTFFAGSLDISVEEASEYLATFEGAAQSACWFWEQNNLNRFADANDVKGLTKAINGGYIGLDDRISHTEHALHILGA